MRPTNLAEARARYEAALSKRETVDDLHALGLIEFEERKFGPAVDRLRRAIALAPTQPDLRNSLGVTLQAAGRIGEAISAYLDGLRLAPDFAELHLNVGGALHVAGRLTDAAAHLAEAVRLRPHLADGYFNLGNVLRDQGRHELAVTSYQQAIRLDPKAPAPLTNLGDLYKRMGRMADALTTLEQAVAAAPRSPEALICLGTLYHEMGRNDDAIGCYDRAQTVAPGMVEPWSNIGVSLQSEGRFDEALEAYDRAIAIKPKLPEPHMHRGMALLTAGNYAEGWAAYEWRWRSGAFEAQRRNFVQPRWTGQPVEGRTILLYGEQGFGDMIQFVRYGQLLHRLGARVVVETEPELVRLMAGADWTAQVLAKGSMLPPFDFHIQMLSLPYMFGSVVATVPAEVPYLTPPADLVRKWAARFADVAGFKVGLVWAGRPEHRRDHERSLSLDLLAPLGLVRGVKFFSLQMGPRAQDILPGRPDLPIESLGNFEDFADTAAAITNLDLVISVDTAVSHLTGALAKPNWVLLPAVPDWRWLLEREDCPWYPMTRLFRQPVAGDWRAVTADLARELRAAALLFNAAV
jgi:tetratricopeptide (TPR) repeat protein